ncbi:MAG: TetR/AcrR family transcriptional regulator [Spirochaetes bacterium]|nr:TetR/AcrR family transcriptional regulator [Spirochaetota bacterium]
MAYVVKHEKRRTEILKNALAVFVDDGFENTTFQKIADRSGITRTTLYLYFKNKREIFNYSIKQMLVKAEEDIGKIEASKSLGSVEKITRILLDILKLLEDNQRLLSVIMDYLLHLPKNEGPPELRVRRRTLKMRRAISSIIREGIKAGELKKANVKTADDFFYSIIEAAIFHLAILKRENLDEMKNVVVFAAKQFATQG